LVGIIGHLPSAKGEEKGVSFYQWEISNKYYDASIHFCPMTTRVVIDEDFSENVNASVVFFNSSEVRKIYEVVAGSFFTCSSFLTTVLICIRTRLNTNFVPLPFPSK
jgi:hypothetical protein